MTGAEILFLIFAAATCGGALAVVFSQNVARMAFWLIVSLGSTSGLFFLLRADFVGATQLLIYVGGTVVLLIFGVMLTDSGPYLRIRSLLGRARPGRRRRPAAVVDDLFDASSWSIGRKMSPRMRPEQVGQGYNPSDEGNTARPIGMKLLGVSLEDRREPGARN